ncbi:hypothetical protein ACSBR2_016008 [Camellia fascicularis]
MTCGKESGETDEIYECNFEDTLDGSKKIEAPKAGMTFGSKDEVHQYYASYARQEGFEVMIKTSRQGDNGSIKYFTLACVRTGKTYSCSDGTFSLAKFVLEHNHSLSPGKTHFFQSNKMMGTHVKRRLELNDQAGINVSKNFDSLVVEAEGHEHLSFTEKDCRNYIEKMRRLRLGTGDAEAILTYFTKIQNKNSSFFYVMDLNDDGRLKNVF